ncbi:NADH-quinone oxidoreductase subunit A [Candidatus Jidaibacter acanthamoebae]|nr:NADH-quinone oxidoreductase subunit A [Candidatus Jidaibacter acanthamoeba]MBA8666793.1 NADH-quinone oxidoreductase subunit A [Holosporaceae bacterium 'Namur']
MQHILTDYLPILLFLILAGGLAFIMSILPFLLATLRGDSEKLSSYECGFEAFDAPRSKFDVRFYLVSILFIIFDLEIAFLFPWAIVIRDIGLLGFWSMIIFLVVLTIGFIYEWKKGALDWE